MSQEKVDRYKKSKANRKQEVKKVRIERRLEKLIIGLIGLALLVWIGISIFKVYESKKPYPSYTINYDAITDYSSTLQS